MFFGVLSIEPQHLIQVLVWFVEMYKDSISNNKLDEQRDISEDDDTELEAELTGMMTFKGFFLEWVISRDFTGINEESEDEFVGSDESQEMGFTVEHKDVVYDFGPTYRLDVMGYTENPKGKKVLQEAFNINASLINLSRAAYHIGISDTITYLDWGYEWTSICQQVFGLSPLCGYFGANNENAWMHHADIDQIFLNSINHHFGTRYGSSYEVDDLALINFLYKNKDVDTKGSVNASLIINSMDAVLRKVFNWGRGGTTLKALKAYPLQYVPGFEDQCSCFDIEWLKRKSFDKDLNKLTELYRQIGFSCKNEYGHEEYLLAKKIK